jgi:predicted PurR-regulated permease PerM
MVKIIVIFAAAAVLSVGLAILFNKIVIKDYPEKGRKAKYAATIVVFLLITLALGGVLFAKSVTNTAIKEYTNKLEQYIKDTHPDNG